VKERECVWKIERERERESEGNDEIVSVTRRGKLELEGLILFLRFYIWWKNQPSHFKQTHIQDFGYVLVHTNM